MMPGPNGEMCGNCQAFNRRQNCSGDCRLRAPDGPGYIVGQEGDVITKSPWPQVHAADWCIGDFLAKEKVSG